MNKEEFIKYIESIGFIDNNDELYVYKGFGINLYYSYYNFFNGSEWEFDIPYNDLKPLLKIIRSIKLKQLLK